MTVKLDKQLALLALALDDKKPTGKKPSLLDIDLWRRGKLNKKRNREVTAFVAHDSDCYQQWMDLLDSEQLLATEEKRTNASFTQVVSNWFLEINNLWLGGGLAFATTAVLIVMVSLQTMTPSDLYSRVDGDYIQFNGDPMAVHWYYQSNEKSFDFKLPSTYDWLKPAVLHGVREGLLKLQQTGQLETSEPWNEVIAYYPSELPVCPDAISAESCIQQQTVLHNLGRSLALMQLHCAQTITHSSADFYIEQHNRLVGFKDLISSYQTLSPLIEQLNTAQETNDKVEFCGQIKQLLNSFDG